MFGLAKAEPKSDRSAAAGIGGASCLAFRFCKYIE
jgi:hypothetical protein